MPRIINDYGIEVDLVMLPNGLTVERTVAEPKEWQQLEARADIEKMNRYLNGHVRNHKVQTLG